MSGNERVFQKAMNDGHNAAWDQDWQRAANYYRLALEQFPQHQGALSNLGLALFELKDFAGALKIYQRAAMADQNDPLPVEKIANLLELLKRSGEAVRAYAQAAEMYLKVRDPEKAIENWTRVIEMQPENLNGYARLAMIYERMGHKSEAVSFYLVIAALLQKAGDTNKAAQAVMYALKLMPGSAEATQALHQLKSGQPLARPGQPRPTTASLREPEARPTETPQTEELIPTLDPISEARQRALVQLAEILFEDPDAGGDGKDSQGVHPLVRGTGGLPIDQADQQRILLHIGQAIEWQTQGADNLAASELDSALEIGLSHPALHFDLGLLMLAQNQVEKAVLSLEKAVRDSAFALAGYLLLGRIYYDQANYHDAAVCNLQALRLADAATAPEGQAAEILQIYDTLIEAQIKQAEEKELKSMCETISSELLREDWRELLVKARQQLPEQVDGAMAQPVAEMLLESRGGEAIEAMAVIKELARQGKVRTALEEAFHAMELSPTYLPLHIQIGELLLQQDMIPEAIRKFLLVAQLYRVRGQNAQAINVLKKMIPHAPTDMQIRTQLIELLTTENRPDEAMQQHLELADIYYRLGELNNARHGYLSALRLVQQTQRNRRYVYEILNHLADIDMQRLDWRQALRTYEQMRTLKPDDKVARQRVIDINFRLGNDPAAFTELDDYLKLLEKTNKRPEAVSFIYALLADQPEKPELRGRLAEFHLREGKVGMAINELDQLAVYYEETGDIQNACRTVEQILKLDPLNRAEYETALQRLRSLQ